MTIQEAPLDLNALMTTLGKAARKASYQLASLSPAIKNAALLAMAEEFSANQAEIIRENEQDLQSALEKGLSPAMIDRLRLDEKAIAGLCKAVREIAALDDPIGQLENIRVRPNGLRLGHMRAPIGVIGIIYESRPNVTVDAGALCLKSGNAVILRGGSEAVFSNRSLARLMNQACQKSGVPEGAIQLIPTQDRAAVGELLKADEYVDLIIPRGGKDLIRRITQDSIIPVIKHLDGNCFVYVDEFADLEMALPIVINAKTHRTGVCNATETLLVHQAVADQFMPLCLNKLLELGVEIRGCQKTQAYDSRVVPATDADWDEEYLAMILAVKVIDSFESAVEFINKHSSGHTEAIISNHHSRVMAFTRSIDSACVHVNCSTRFSDGGEYGLGAEIGISTNKLHARGPMGLRELTTAKWICLGEGQIRH
ncbi:MAG: glutamate-5-semialdehyde dehydrogenase [Sumerlaeia bacterium]